MCCVMPPASEAATWLFLRLSSRVVFPWSTWPMMVTTGGRGTRLPGSAGGLAVVREVISMVQARRYARTEYQTGNMVVKQFPPMWLFPVLQPKIPCGTISNFLYKWHQKN